MTAQQWVASAATGWCLVAASCASGNDSTLQPVPVPLTLATNPESRRMSAQINTAAAGSNATVTLSGDNSTTTGWTATKRQSWTTLTTASGTGSGTVAWSRSTAGLAVGTYVDTITVTVAGVTPQTVIDTLIITAAPPTTDRPDLGLNASFHGIRLFPENDLWNRPVDTAQVDPNSGAILAAIGLTKSLHPDFGANWNGGPFGIPYIVVPDSTLRSSLIFEYAGESDPGPYPIPANPPIEPGNGDRHLLVVTQDEFKLFELFYLNGGPGAWTAGSGAIFDLRNGTVRPAGWTSADAAGLPILPGLVRYDEVVEQGTIKHALRFTVSRTRRAYLAPARHWASSSTDPLRAPMGMRVRLKANYDISGFAPQAQVILRALKRYGMIVADNGGDFFISGTADARWNDDVNNTLKAVKVGDFEVVRMVGVVGP